MLRPSPIFKACASERDGRPVLAAVNLRDEGEHGRWLEATDSYKLARVPADPPSDEALAACGLREGVTDDPGILPAAAFRAAYKGAAKARDARAILANGEVQVRERGAEQRFERPDLGTFPNVPQLMPQNEASFRVVLNPRLLAELAAAIDSPEAVEIRFTAGKDGEPNELRPLLVIARDGAYGTSRPAHERGHGLLMPIRPHERAPFPAHTRAPESK